MSQSIRSILMIAVVMAPVAAFAQRGGSTHSGVSAGMTTGLSTHSSSAAGSNSLGTNSLGTANASGGRTVGSAGSSSLNQQPTGDDAAINQEDQLIDKKLKSICVHC